MEKEVRRIKKIMRLLKRMNFPKWLHHFGPKTYEFYEHLVALLMRIYCRLSYRRLVDQFNWFGIRCPSKSALQYTAKKLSSTFWNKVLEITCGSSYLTAIDSTGLSRTNPSYHYLKRINGCIPKKYVKLSVAFDTKKKKFHSARIRVLPRHDSLDARYLIASSQPQVVVADKAYSSEKLYAFCEEKDILFMSPKKKGTFRGHCRNKMMKRFRTRTYNRRVLVEASFSALKRKFGASVSSRSVRTIRTEVYGRLVCHNLFGCLYRLLGQSLLFR